MKQAILVFILLVLSQFTWAQKFKVFLNDGTSVTFDVSKVDSVKFYTDEEDNPKEEDNNDDFDVIPKSIIGQWRILKVEDYTDGVLDEDQTDYGPDAYFDFTDTTMAIKDCPPDMFNGVPWNYAYFPETGSLNVAMWVGYHTVKMTSSTKMEIYTTLDWGEPIGVFSEIIYLEKK